MKTAKDFVSAGLTQELADLDRLLSLGFITPEEHKRNVSKIQGQLDFLNY